MRAIILLGAPGAGKGTAAARIRDAAGFTHFSTGDMLRESVRQATEIGNEAVGYMHRGELVPDAVIMRLVESRLAESPDSAAYLFDGFPRTLRQAELLESVLARRGSRLEHVVFLDAPTEVLVQRLSGRRICRSCGANFHIKNMPPLKPGVCDTCGGELYQRADDSEGTIMSRLKVFNEKTEALIAFYEGQGLLRRVDSSRGAEELAADVLGVIGSA